MPAGPHCAAHPFDIPLLRGLRELDTRRTPPRTCRLLCPGQRLLRAPGRVLNHGLQNQTAWVRCPLHTLLSSETRGQPWTSLSLGSLTQPEWDSLPGHCRLEEAARVTRSAGSLSKSEQLVGGVIIPWARLPLGTPSFPKPQVLSQSSACAPGRSPETKKSADWGHMTNERKA